MISSWSDFWESNDAATVVEGTVVEVERTSGGSTQVQAPVSALSVTLARRGPLRGCNAAPIVVRSGNRPRTQQQQQKYQCNQHR